jgi:hypothetical protein
MTTQPTQPAPAASSPLTHGVPLLSALHHFGTNQDTTMKLQIRSNNYITDHPCAVCGGPTTLDLGPTIVLQGTWEPVCDGCVTMTAPELRQRQQAMHQQFIREVYGPSVLPPADAPDCPF